MKEITEKDALMSSRVALTHLIEGLKLLYQASPSEETGCAIIHCEEAFELLVKRTRLDVEGKHS